jgi:hypothetical protein
LKLPVVRNGKNDASLGLAEERWKQWIEEERR